MLTDFDAFSRAGTKLFNAFSERLDGFLQHGPFIVVSVNGGTDLGQFRFDFGP